MGKRQECSAADSGCLTYNESPLMGDSQKAIRVTEKLTFVIKVPDVEDKT